MLHAMVATLSWVKLPGPLITAILLGVYVVYHSCKTLGKTLSIFSKGTSSRSAHLVSNIWSVEKCISIKRTIRESLHKTIRKSKLLLSLGDKLNSSNNSITKHYEHKSDQRSFYSTFSIFYHTLISCSSHNNLETRIHERKCKYRTDKKCC